MQLYGGAGGLRHDRPGGPDQAFDAVDVEREVLPAHHEDLLVEQRVAVHRRKVRGDQVRARDRRQNTDHHHSGVDLRRLPVGIAQPRAEFLGELVENPAAEPVRKDVHLQIEHSKLGLEIGARNPLQHLCIQHSRQPVGTREIQFDLQSHHVLRAIEPLLRQEPLQSLQTLVKLPSIPLPIGQVESACHDLLPHRSVPPRVGLAQYTQARVTVDDAPAA